jgi:hypothetical protein
MVLRPNPTFNAKPPKSGKLWRPLILDSRAAPGFHLCANPRFRSPRALILLEPRRASNQVDIVILSFIHIGCFGIMSARPKKYIKMLINILCGFHCKASKSGKLWHPLMLGSRAAPGFRLCTHPQLRFSRALILLEPRRVSIRVDIVIMSLIHVGCFGIMSARSEKYIKMCINNICGFQGKDNQPQRTQRAQRDIFFSLCPLSALWFFVVLQKS